MTNRWTPHPKSHTEIRQAFQRMSEALDAVEATAGLITQTNSNAGTIVIGQPVYNDGNDTVDLAKADAAGTVEVLGLVYSTSIVTTESGLFVSDGLLEATTTQWDAITGGSGGLTFGIVYYLDPTTAGKLTTTGPTAAGKYVVRIGRAISTTKLEISISQPILL